jgi:outer membrane immunogenic protein
MQKFTIGLAAATILAMGSAQSALAADMAVPYYKAPPPPISTWTGFYVGGNIGYSWGRETNSWDFLGFPVGGETQTLNGVIGGGQWGFNWQKGNWVFGMEGDFQGSGERGTGTFGFGPIPVALLSFTDAQSLTWFGTDRGRIGFLATPNILLYGTGGVAYGHLNSSYTLNVIGFPLANIGTSETRAGWTAGAGIEGKLGSNWTAKLEYLHIDLGSLNSNFSVVSIPIAGLNQRFTDDLVRVGVNYLWPL